MVEFEKDIVHCLEILEAGGLILYPTDTVWGIGCDATNEVSVEKVYQLKQRADEKAMIVLVADERDILKHTASPDLSIFDYLERTRKPTTVIYDHGLGLADNLKAKDGSVAMRICRDEFCKHLIKRFRRPIVSTSANISGENTARIFSEIKQEIKEGVDYIVKFRQEDMSVHEPSSVIKWKNGKIEVIRV